MKNKILFIVPLPPPVHGASLRNKSLIESKVLTSAFDLIIIPIQFVKDNSDIGKFSISKVLKVFTLVYAVIKNIIKKNPNLVYINMATYGFALYRDSAIVFLAKILRKKVAIHLRTQRINEQSRTSIFKKKLFQIVFYNTSIICLSEYLSTDVRDVYSKKVNIVNNGIELFDTTNLHPKKRNIKTVRFLFLSNLVKTKGVFDLIDAASNLKFRNREFEVFIVGKDAELTTTELKIDISKKGLDDNVRVFQAAYDNKKVQFFLDSDVFIFPTHFEAFPGVVLEAMQLGLPVISTNEGAIPEIVDHMKNGIIVGKGQIDELALAMDYFINNKQSVKSFGEAAKEKFKSNYTLQKFEHKMRDTFETLLNLP